MPTRVVDDLPPNFWHPSMMPVTEEDKVGEDEHELEVHRDAPSWLQRLGATIIAGCFVAIVVAVTIRIIMWILEGV